MKKQQSAGGERSHVFAIRVRCSYHWDTAISPTLILHGPCRCNSLKTKFLLASYYHFPAWVTFPSRAHRGVIAAYKCGPICPTGYGPYRTTVHHDVPDISIYYFYTALIRLKVEPLNHFLSMSRNAFEGKIGYFRNTLAQKGFNAFSRSRVNGAQQHFRSASPFPSMICTSKARAEWGVSTTAYWTSPFRALQIWFWMLT